MDQITQQLKSGKMEILEVPFPSLGKGQVLVRNHYSVISAGTEGKTVKDARLGYVGKARTRQKELKQVIDSIKINGFVKTYNVVMNKLESPSSLGYSCAGEVIALGDGISDLNVGDFVACGGGGAVHAEVISSNRNLCVKVPETVNLKHAAFTTVASIAMQGFRQSDLRLGESCVVIGLGLIGQFTIQVLNSAGIKTIGIDIDDSPVELAKKCGADLALNGNREDIEKIVFDSTGGYGADAVIITAGASSTGPIDLAGSLCRKKGKVIVVGAIPTGFSRPNYYKKELDLRMSCSYGPGRYDIDYEEKGVDYPIGHVRWTENRNMQAYIELLKKNSLNIDQLISHEFDLENAPDAYQIIVDRSEKFSGILIKYRTDKPLLNKVIINNKEYSNEKINIGFVGAGSFAQNTLLPVVKKLGNMVGVATARGNSARNATDKYGFDYCTGIGDEIVTDSKINTVFIATRHNLHAEYVLKSLQNEKHIFVEKPLCMSLDELNQINDEYQKKNCHLMVGFNRRFSPHVQQIQELFLPNQTKSINIRINAGAAPKDHWIHDPEIGGGRIVGEVCHFVDLAMFLAKSKIVTVSANVIQGADNLQDTLVINLTFENGSIASISYFSNGNKHLPKEHIEVFCDGKVASIDDFKIMTVYGQKIEKFKLNSQDKGHTAGLKRFIAAIEKGENTPIPFDQIYNSTAATFAILNSIQRNQFIKL